MAIAGRPVRPRAGQPRAVGREHGIADCEAKRPLELPGLVAEGASHRRRVSSVPAMMRSLSDCWTPQARPRHDYPAASRVRPPASPHQAAGSRGTHCHPNWPRRATGSTSPVQHAGRRGCGPVAGRRGTGGAVRGFAQQPPPQGVQRYTLPSATATPAISPLPSGEKLAESTSSGWVVGRQQGSRVPRPRPALCCRCYDSTRHHSSKLAEATLPKCPAIAGLLADRAGVSSRSGVIPSSTPGSPQSASCRD